MIARRRDDPPCDESEWLIGSLARAMGRVYGERDGPRRGQHADADDGASVAGPAPHGLEGPPGPGGLSVSPGGPSTTTLC